jgi:MFS family permease
MDACDKGKSDARLMFSMFFTFYAIHCMEQVYFIYGNVLESYGLSPQTTGNALGSFFIAVMIARPVGGWMIENLGIKRSLVCGGILALVGCVTLFFARGVTGIYFGRVMSGLAFGVFTMGAFSYQALAIPPETRGRFVAVTSTGGVLPTATITPVGEWLFIGGHVGSYLAIGPAMSALCLYLGLKTDADRAGREPRPKTWGAYRDLAMSKPFVMLTATSTMMALVDAAITSISLFAAERGLVASYFLASFSVAAVLSRVAGARIINALPRQFCVAPCGMLMCVALAIISAAPSNESFLICGTLFGVGIGGGFPMLLASLSDILPPQLRPKGTAAALMLYDMAWAATPILVGYMTPLLGRAVSFMALAAVTFAALAAISALYWIPRRREELRAPSRRPA